MAITSGVPIPLATASISDSTVTSSGSGETKDVYPLIAHNIDTTRGYAELYLSTDAASAAGERIDKLVLEPDETKEFFPVVIPSGQYLIIKSDVDVNYHGAYTLRNGGDV